MKCQHQHNEDQEMGQLLLAKYLDTLSRIRSFGKILELAACNDSGLIMSDCSDIYDAIFEDLLPECDQEDDSDDCDSSCQ